MSFEGMLAEALKGGTLGTDQYALEFKKRPHVSRSKVEEYGNVAYLKVGDLKATRYENDSSMRYIAARDITYDLLLSIYDVNTSALACARVYGNVKKLEPGLVRFARSIRRPNFEARIIGLQNGESTAELEQVLGFLGREKIKVFEVDLFGADTRHITVDAKVGMSFNILVDDRLYKSGELKSRLTMDQFQRVLGQGKA